MVPLSYPRKFEPKVEHKLLERSFGAIGSTAPPTVAVREQSFESPTVFLKKPSIGHPHKILKVLHLKGWAIQKKYQYTKTTCMIMKPKLLCWGCFFGSCFEVCISGFETGDVCG